MLQVVGCNGRSWFRTERVVMVYGITGGQGMGCRDVTERMVMM